MDESQGMPKEARHKRAHALGHHLHEVQYQAMPAHADRSEDMVAVGL